MSEVAEAAADAVVHAGDMLVQLRLPEARGRCVDDEGKRGSTDIGAHPELVRNRDQKVDARQLRARDPIAVPAEEGDTR